MAFSAGSEAVVERKVLDDSHPLSSPPAPYKSWTEMFNAIPLDARRNFVSSMPSDHAAVLHSILRTEQLESARDSLDAWGRLLFPDEPPARHHRLINNRLEAIEAGRIRNLMIFAPPGSAKTTYTSRRFPSWLVGRNPHKSYIFGTHTLPFAESISYDVQRIVLSSDFRDVFGFGLSKHVTAKAEWMNSMGGKYYATGVGVGVSGKRADGFIGDDFIRNRQDAMSAANRRNQFEWYRTDIRPRLKPSSWKIITVTRWHVSDIPGTILGEDYDGGSGDYLSADGTEMWHVLSLPAIENRENNPLRRSVGDPIWPEWFCKANPNFFKDEEKVQGAYNWSALYQQTPILVGGITLEREWFKVCEVLPQKFRKIVRFWDMASTEESVKNKNPDWTAGLLVGEEAGQYFLLDVRRDRKSPKGVEDLISSTADTDGYDVGIHIEQEPGSSGKSIVSSYQRNHLRGYSVRGERSTGSKITRADLVSVAAENGNMFIKRALWNEKFLDEVETFPVGSFDDQIDALSGAIKVLSERKKKAGTWGR